MTDSDILARLEALFREVFDDASLKLHMATNANDIPGWDSMAQVTLAVEIEHIFNIRILSAEMEELRNVGEMTDFIKSRMVAVA